jgi:hypothetical protein
MMGASRNNAPSESACLKYAAMNADAALEVWQAAREKHRDVNA